MNLPFLRTDMMIRIVMVFIVILIVTLILAYLLNVKIIVAFATSLATFVVWMLLERRKKIREVERISGLSSEEGKAMLNDLVSGNESAALQRIQEEQERNHASLRELGIDPLVIIPVIGQDIKWSDIVRQVFRVLEFDRADTTVLANGTVKAATLTKPYGYLLVESPILNVKACLPIIHRNDFALAMTVYDNPQLYDMVAQKELLVTYFPKYKLPMGFAGITHALHYVIVPRGTLERYYEFNNDEHMTNPAPEKLFKRFAWGWKIRVEVNTDPEF